MSDKEKYRPLREGERRQRQGEREMTREKALQTILDSIYELPDGDWVEVFIDADELKRCAVILRPADTIRNSLAKMNALDSGKEKG